MTISSAVRDLLAKLATSCAAVKVGGGRLLSASWARETLPSRRPEGTWYARLPVRLMLSRAAKATMSAQDTVLGQLCSTAALAASMTWNPWRLGLLGAASRSAVPFGEVSSTDASQPLTKQSWKWSRMRPAAMPESLLKAFATACRTSDSALGQLVL
uniref:Uncharacterized protein n=1 Tax=Arundo donax TaxID=35708 RepID=A0A0A9ESE6_ARUDO